MASTSSRPSRSDLPLDPLFLFSHANLICLGAVFVPSHLPPETVKCLDSACAIRLLFVSTADDLSKSFHAQAQTNTHLGHVQLERSFIVFLKSSVHLHTHLPVTSFDLGTHPLHVVAHRSTGIRPLPEFDQRIRTTKRQYWQVRMEGHTSHRRCKA